MAALSEAEVRAHLQNTAGWALAGGEIERTFAFGSFPAAIAFVNRLADAAERAGHHPDITVNYNRVKLALSTHSEGGITQKDFDLAREINRLEHGT
jgi:4a-hydroxytetrahydrobiopterin dehydratase